MANDVSDIKSLVIVEDDPDDQYFLMSAFREIGFAQFVICFDSSEQLFEYLAEQSASGSLPYAVLLDYNMPVMSGEEILVALKKHPEYHAINVLIYSTTVNRPLIDRLKELGADGCYAKSSTANGIIEFVEFLKQKITAAVFR